MGYYRAGFDVVGVDIKPMPRYPFEFHQCDALEYVREHGAEFDAIHASPPCQGYSTQLNCWPGKEFPKLINDTRKILTSLGVPYIIENVPGARSEMNNPIVLCGMMFDLKVYRHRCFESSFMLLHPPHIPHDDSTPRAGHGISPKGFLSVTGHSGFKGETELRKRAMGIDWMTGDELSEAIPPAYTEFIGRYLLEAVQARRLTGT